MTMAYEQPRELFTGTGTTGPFAVPFTFQVNSHIKVARLASSGTGTELAEGADYTLTGGPDAGSITLATALAVGQKLAVWREQPIAQETDFAINGQYRSSVVEDALDRLTEIVQEIDERTRRSLRGPATDPLDIGSEFPSAPARANKLAAFGPDGEVVALDADEAAAWVDGTELGVRPISSGGTGGSTAAEARSNLGIGAIGQLNSIGSSDIATAHAATDHRAIIRAYNQTYSTEAQQDVGNYVVESATTTSLPSVVPANGTAYLLPASASSNPNKIAIVESGSWAYKTAAKGWRALARDTDAEWYYDGTAWAQVSGTGSTSSSTTAATANGRVAGYAITNGNGGDRWRAHWTVDNRIYIFGDQSKLGFDPVGDSWNAFVVPWDTTNNGNITAMYAGINYLLILSDQSTGNVYHMGLTDNGQGGRGATSGTTLVPTRITQFVTDAVKISYIWTEGSYANTEKAWFALTTGGNVYSCGYSGAQQTMGYNSTTNLSTPRKMTTSDGTTAIANIDSISFATPGAPVWAHTTANEAYRWGAGTDGAHGNNNTTAISWPTKLETSVGSGVARTDITQVVVAGYTTRSISWILTTSGKIQASGSRYYGMGDGAALTSASVNTFQNAVGAMAALTVSSIYAGGGDGPSCLAITSTGTGYLVGFAGSVGGLGTGGSTSLHTFTALGTLPTGFSGALTKARIAGATATYCTIYLEATISGLKKLASIGSDDVYKTAKGTTGVAAGSQTWGLILGAQGNVSSWQVVGDTSNYGIEVLDQDGLLWYAGANDQGQGGCQFGNLHSVAYLQPCIPAINRQPKAPTSKGSYAGGTTYSPQDWVTYQGSSWLCILETTGNAPPTIPTTSNTYWTLFAQKGSPDTSEFGFEFDGGTSALTVGMKGRKKIPFNCTITEVSLYADAVGSLVIDVWKDTHANYPPTVADSIAASAKPTLSSANKSLDTTLTGWTTTLSAGDVVIANIDSVSGISYATLSFKIQRS